MLLNCGVGEDKQIQSVHQKKKKQKKKPQSGVLIGRTDAEAEGPIFLPTDAKN